MGELVRRPVPDGARMRSRRDAQAVAALKRQYAIWLAANCGDGSCLAGWIEHVKVCSVCRTEVCSGFASLMLGLATDTRKKLGLATDTKKRQAGNG